MIKRIVYTSLLTLAFISALAASLMPTATSSAHAISSATSNTALTWYFAEGRVGAGFLQWLTIDNPNAGSCAVNVKYDYSVDGSSVSQNKTIPIVVDGQTRYTESVNNDLAVSQDAATGVTLSAVVSVDQGSTPTCTGVTVERPMYFQDFHSVSSGTDVLGNTSLSTKYYFADIPTGAAGETFLSILNPGTIAANVVVTYYASGAEAGHETVTIAPNSRGTVQPNNSNLPAHVAAIVTSDRPIMVERPSYFVSNYGVSGAADITGATALSADWLYAEGNTASGYKENLAIANLGPAPASVTITLKSLNGTTQAYTLALAADSQTIWDVNAHNTFAGATSEVAVEIKADSAALVAERQIYSTYKNGAWSASGVSDSMGAPAPATSYAFAEGFTSQGFDELLTLQNPTDATENISVNLVNMYGDSYTATFAVGAQSRYTVNINDLVTSHLVSSGEDDRAYAVSMNVTASSPFVAERVMEWNAFNTAGASAVVGYAG